MRLGLTRRLDESGGKSGSREVGESESPKVREFENLKI